MTIHQVVLQITKTYMLKLMTLRKFKPKLTDDHIHWIGSMKMITAQIKRSTSKNDQEGFMTSTLTMTKMILMTHQLMEEEIMDFASKNCRICQSIILQHLVLLLTRSQTISYDGFSPNFASNKLS